MMWGNWIGDFARGVIGCSAIRKSSDSISELEGFARQNLLDVFGNWVVVCRYFWNRCVREKSVFELSISQKSQNEERVQIPPLFVLGF